MTEKWQGAVDDLKMKSFSDEVRRLRKVEEFFNHLKPGVSERWEEFFLQLSSFTGDEEGRRKLIDRLVDDDYYKYVWKALDKADRNLAIIKFRKSQTFSMS